MKTDITVTEVRMRRQELANAFDCDITKIMNSLQKSEQRHPERLVDGRNLKMNQMQSHRKNA